MPSRPAASTPAVTMYGFDMPDAARCSTWRDDSVTPLMRISADRSSWPHEMLDGANVCGRRRFWQLTVGTSSV